MNKEIEINGTGINKDCQHCKSEIFFREVICPICKKYTAYPIPKILSHLNLFEVEKLINEAFFRLENFMNCTLSDYKYFGFGDYFTKLFFECQKLENFTIENCIFIINYYDLILQISRDTEDDTLENKELYDNDEFCNDCDEISRLANFRFDEFFLFFSADENAEINAPAKISITNIQRKKAENLPPAIYFIFNNKNNAYEVFKGLLEDLQITILGQPQTKAGRVGKLTGLITAIKETPGMLKLEKPTDDQLLTYFNEHLKTSYKTFSKRNEDYLPSVDDAKRYIKNHFKK